MFQSQSKEIWGWKRCKKSSEPASLILGTARGALAAAWSDLSSSRFIPSRPQSLTSSLNTRSSLRQRAQHATTLDQVLYGLPCLVPLAHLLLGHRRAEVTQLKTKVSGDFFPIRGSRVFSNVQGVGTMRVGSLYAGLLAKEDLQVHTEYLLWMWGGSSVQPHKGRHSAALFRLLLQT